MHCVCQLAEEMLQWPAEAVQWQEAHGPMLLMDHFVMFMLEPGRTVVPDQRCALRLVKALLVEIDSGTYAATMQLMPVQVQVMVSKLPRDISGDTLLPQLVKAWWEFNGRSVFFAHNLTAKLVRKMIKVF